MTDPRDITGVWYGRYRSNSGDQDNSFIALLEEGGGVFDGTISEPDDTRGTGGIRQASVAGRRDGASLDFIKQYHGSAGMTHSVHYSGGIDDQGTVISGVWVVSWLRGTFTMQREKFDEDELEDAESISLETH